jgi:hypothetical protein|tara:strand:- start:412 stop:915 length:504 start_codon:yes stop_codon:yes gene_type:complete
MTNYWLFAIIAGVSIIIALVFYASKLLKKVAHQTEEKKIAAVKHHQALQGHDKKVLDSVVIIVRAMKAAQCDFSEGCWRLSVLLNSLKTSQEVAQQFPAIFELYNRIKALSILDSRKELAKSQRMKEDLQRIKAEAELHNAIEKDLVLLHQYAVERISVLTAADNTP